MDGNGVGGDGTAGCVGPSMISVGAADESTSIGLFVGEPARTNVGMFVIAMMLVGTGVVGLIVGTEGGLITLLVGAGVFRDNGVAVGRL
mmetsp:Transcript_15637/g.23808  ORF Transcript_15637/g.23808 Transcript_15637/m.23808 type:complete len:89 (+) Transcript_15637:59-325(+)